MFSESLRLKELLFCTGHVTLLFTPQAAISKKKKKMKFVPTSRYENSPFYFSLFCFGLID